MPFDGGIIDATPTRRVLHLQYIDSEGKPRTDSYDIPDAASATDSDLNAFAAEMGALSNASLYSVGVTAWFQPSVASKANAVDETNDSVKDNVVILMKDASNNSFDLFIPANSETLTMIAGTENPDATLLATLFSAAAAVWASYTPVSVRFTERKLKNRATKL